MITAFLMLCFIAVILLLMFAPFIAADTDRCKCGPHDGADIVCPKCNKRRRIVVRTRADP